RARLWRWRMEHRKIELVRPPVSVRSRTRRLRLRRRDDGVLGFASAHVVVSSRAHQLVSGFSSLAMKALHFVSRSGSKMRRPRVLHQHIILMTLIVLFS